MYFILKFTLKLKHEWRRVLYYSSVHHSWGYDTEHNQEVELANLIGPLIAMYYDSIYSPLTLLQYSTLFIAIVNVIYSTPTVVECL